MNYITINNYFKKNNNYFTVHIPAFNFESGKVYGIFGPNGSGKTTLLKSITKYNTNYDGFISVYSDISFLPDNLQFMKWMNVDDIIKMYIDFFKDFDKERFEFIFEGFSGTRDTLLKNLSKGQLELVFLALTFGRKVNIYILDEPFHGLDLKRQESSITKILSLLDEETTLIMTTHYPYNIQNIFDEAIYMKNGMIEKVLHVVDTDSVVSTYKEVFSDV